MQGGSTHGREESEGTTPVYNMETNLMERPTGDLTFFTLWRTAGISSVLGLNVAVSPKIKTDTIYNLHRKIMRADVSVNTVYGPLKKATTHLLTLRTSLKGFYAWLLLLLAPMTDLERPRLAFQMPDTLLISLLFLF